MDRNRSPFSGQEQRVAQSRTACYTKPMLDTVPLLATWPNGWTVHRVRTSSPVPHDLGQWLLAHKLYAEGNDFTSEWAQSDPTYEGNSMLRRFWRGEKNRVNLHAKGMDLWVLSKDGEPQGVVAWMRTTAPGEPFPIFPTKENVEPGQRARLQIPAANLGIFMTYLKKEHRGAGLIRRTVAHFVAPEILACARECRAHGGFPYVGAKDAAASILKGQTNVPVVDELSHSRERVDQIWDHWTVATRWAEQRTPQQEFLIPPQPIQPKTKPNSKSDEIPALPSKKKKTFLVA